MYVLCLWYFQKCDVIKRGVWVLGEKVFLGNHMGFNPARQAANVDSNWNQSCDFSWRTSPLLLWTDEVNGLCWWLYSSWWLSYCPLLCWLGSRGCCPLGICPSPGRQLGFWQDGIRSGWAELLLWRQLLRFMHSVDSWFPGVLIAQRVSMKHQCCKNSDYFFNWLCVRSMRWLS